MAERGSAESNVEDSMAAAETRVPVNGQGAPPERETDGGGPASSLLLIVGKPVMSGQSELIIQQINEGKVHF